MTRLIVLLALLLPAVARADPMLGPQRVLVVLTAEQGRSYPSRSTVVSICGTVAGWIQDWSYGQASVAFEVTDWNVVTYNPCKASGQDLFADAIANGFTTGDWSYHSLIFVAVGSSGCYWTGGAAPNVAWPFYLPDGTSRMYYLVNVGGGVSAHVLGHELFHTWNIGHANTPIGWPVGRATNYGETANLMGNPGAEELTPMAKEALGWVTPRGPGPLRLWSQAGDYVKVRRAREDYLYAERRSSGWYVRALQSQKAQITSLLLARSLPFTDPTSGITLQESAPGAIAYNVGDPDTIPPTAHFLEPAEGDTVSNPITIRLSVEDDRAVGDLVVAPASNAWSQRLTGPPWEIVLDAWSVPSGPELLLATARDASGNVSDVLQRRCVVRNEPLIAPWESVVPRVWVMCPAGDLGDSVVVRDETGTPMQGIVVNAQVVWDVGHGCGVLAPAYLSVDATTDARGVARFAFAGGGAGRVYLNCDGTHLNSWSDPSYLVSPDMDGDGSILVGDVARVTRPIKLGTWSLDVAARITIHVKEGHRCQP